MRLPDVFQIDRQSSAQARDHEVTFNRTHTLCLLPKPVNLIRSIWQHTKQGPWLAGCTLAPVPRKPPPPPPSETTYLSARCKISVSNFPPISKKVSSKTTQTSTMATFLRLLRAPAANLRIAAPRLSGVRAFATSQILRQATVAVPTKRPVGAFRGGYVLYTTLRRLPRCPHVVGPGSGAGNWSREGTSVG